MNKNKPILIGNALPYANGYLHIGHLSALLGGDVLARYFRLSGQDVVFVSGSDCYGTPIAIEALSKNIKPEEIVDKYHKSFEETFKDISFSFDYFTKTTNSEHHKVAQEIFLDLYKKEYIYIKKEEGLYSPELEKFLPDRFVEGICPHCGYDGARGDQCDDCGKLIEAITLKNPRLNKKVIPLEKDIKGTLEVRETENFYLKLSAFQKQLEELVQTKGKQWRKNAANFTEGFLKQGLKDRAITRDTDWGVPIPIEGYEEKRMYVWFEAVLAYLSATISLKGNDEWEKWWLNETAKQYYVQGKDNIVFHTIIFPAILIATGKEYNLPDYLFSSELISLEGQQLSTSRNHAIWVKDVIKEIDSDFLRYYLLAHGTEKADVDFKRKEFIEVVNGELVDKVSNLVHRVCSFVQKNFPEGIEVVNVDMLKDQEKEFVDVFEKVGENISTGKFAAALKIIMNEADKGNLDVHKAEPWKTIKEDEEKTKENLVLFLHRIQALGILIQPFTPKTSYKLQEFFGKEIIKSEEGKDNLWKPPVIQNKYVVSNVEPLLKKIEKDEINF